MRKFWKTLLIALVCLSMELPAAATHTVDEVRAQYAQITTTDQLYDSDGALTAQAQQSMLDYARFMRWLAYVEDPLEISDEYTQLAQAGAQLLAAADTTAHELPQPEGFPDDLYALASAGIGGANIASINWMDVDVLFAAIEYFQRDEGGRNRFALGHRRWLLSPALQHTGFGLANAESGMTYVTMYVHDFTAESINSWSHIAWPSAGAFPAEYMYDQTPWCVILNDRVYCDEQPELRITAACEQTGEVFVMDRLAEEDAQDAYWLNTDGYGLGYALVFRPWSETEFEQNQVWHVCIANLQRLDGSTQTLEYDVQMMSLEPIPVRLIELDATQLQLKPGESARITADVVPAWADDVSVAWSSTDETVAVVDVDGTVQAVAPGVCSIIAQGANGQSAQCDITVE